MINVQERSGLEPGDGSGIQDPAALALEHRRQEKFGQPEDGFNVEAHHRDVVLDRYLPRFTAVTVTGIVHQDMNVGRIAAQIVEDFLRGALFLQVLRDHGDMDAVLDRELSRYFLQLGLDRSNEDERMTVAREFVGEMETDPTRRTGDKSSFRIHLSTDRGATRRQMQKNRRGSF